MRNARGEDVNRLRNKPGGSDGDDDAKDRCQRRTASKAVALLEELGILKETTGRQRDRTFSYHRYLDRLRAGIGPM